MADIMITLSTDNAVYTGSMTAEANWAKTDGPLWYPLPTKPRRASRGAKVYFVLDGHIAGRATIESIESKSWKGLTHKGIRLKHTGPAVEYLNVEIASKKVRYLGFQGYRYVEGPLLTRFEKAFGSR
jgi:hypothetical protein